MKQEKISKLSKNYKCTKKWSRLNNKLMSGFDNLKSLKKHPTENQTPKKTRAISNWISKISQMAGKCTNLISDVSSALQYEIGFNCVLKKICKNLINWNGVSIVSSSSKFILKTNIFLQPHKLSWMWSLICRPWRRWACPDKSGRDGRTTLRTSWH